MIPPNSIPGCVVVVPIEGDGNNVVTIHVSDGDGVDIENAKVAARIGNVLYGRGRTDSDGNVSLLLDDNTYSLAVSLSPIYNGVVQSLVVEGTPEEPVEVELTAIAITPSTEEGVTGYLYAYDDENQPEADVNFEVTLVAPDISGRGDASGVWIEESDEDGLVQFVDMIPDADYAIRYLPDGERKYFHTPQAGSDPFLLPSCRE